MQHPAYPESIDVFIGVDVGKGQHHAVALDRGGKRLLDRALPNSEVQLKALIEELRSHGTLLFVVDQPASIEAVPIAVARAEGIAVAYVPGLAMRRIADLHAGEAKTDARDAAIIVEAARCPTHCARSDWRTTRSPNLGRQRLITRLKKLAPRMAERFAEGVYLALSEQHVVMPGTEVVGLVAPRLVQQLSTLRTQREELTREVEVRVHADLLCPVLMSLPGECRQVAIQQCASGESHPNHYQVRVTLDGQQMVEEDAVLQGRKRIEILDVRQSLRHLIDDSIDVHLRQLDQRQHRWSQSGAIRLDGIGRYRRILIAARGGSKRHQGGRGNQCARISAEPQKMRKTRRSPERSGFQSPSTSLSFKAGYPAWSLSRSQW